MKSTQLVVPGCQQSITEHTWVIFQVAALPKQRQRVYILLLMVATIVADHVTKIDSKHLSA